MSPTPPDAPRGAAPEAAPGAAADLPPAVVLDLDGVLADTRHREHHLRGRPKDWLAFFAAAPADGVHPEGLALAAEAAARGAQVVYLSGRPERTRADTERWLRYAGAPPGPVHLRRDGDRRPAPQVKLAALRRLARTARLQVLVDDDPEVVDAVRAAGPGLVEEVLLAEWQPRSAALRAAQEREGRT